MPSGGSIAETIAQSTATATQTTKQSPKLESKNEKNSTMPASMARAAAAMVVEEAKEKESPKLGQSQRYRRALCTVLHHTMRTHVHMRHFNVKEREQSLRSYSMRSAPDALSPRAGRKAKEAEDAPRVDSARPSRLQTDTNQGPGSLPRVRSRPAPRCELTS